MEQELETEYKHVPQEWIDEHDLTQVKNGENSIEFYKKNENNSMIKTEIGDDYEDLLGDKVEAINEVTDDYISEIQDFMKSDKVGWCIL